MVHEFSYCCHWSVSPRVCFIFSVSVSHCPHILSSPLCITTHVRLHRHSLEQCLNSKRRCDPLKRSMGIGSLITSLHRGLLLWYSTKERCSGTLGSPEPRLMQSCRGRQRDRERTSTCSQTWCTFHPALLDKGRKTECFHQVRKTVRIV